MKEDEKIFKIVKFFLFLMNSKFMKINNGCLVFFMANSSFFFLNAGYMRILSLQY